MFRIVNETLFVEKVLPKFFKHNKMDSFIRQVRLFSIPQLNIYGFRKVKRSVSMNTFSHPDFTRNSATLENIHRRVKPRKENLKPLPPQNTIHIF